MTIWIVTVCSGHCCCSSDSIAKIFTSRERAFEYIREQPADHDKEWDVEDYEVTE